MTYDSTKDTLTHIEQVQEFIEEAIDNLVARKFEHDRSKLESPEKEAFDELTPRLRDVTYGSEEYRATLQEMKPALTHHYENNSHHPEHYPNGINGMSLLDLLEMVADWKAASMRHADGNMRDSLEINRKRFRIEPQLFEIIANTMTEMEW